MLVALVPAVAHAAPGAVTLVRSAGGAGTAAEQGFLIPRIWRMHGATAWQPDTWARRSAYALDTTTATAHPEWVLKDSLNRQLYVNGLPAADFGNADYRSWWIAQATTQAAGLRGLYIDDVTMTRRVSLSWGTAATARDPRTLASMTEANWQRYMADFMVAVRAALPSAEIVHDVLWHKGDANADIARELGAASFVALEKGFNDPAADRRLGHLRLPDARFVRRAPSGRGPGRHPRRAHRHGHRAQPRPGDPAGARHRPARARQRPVDRSGPLLVRLRRRPRCGRRHAHDLVRRVAA